MGRRKSRYFEKGISRIDEVICRRNSFYRSSEVYCSQEEILISLVQGKPSQGWRKKQELGISRGFFCFRERRRRGSKEDDFLFENLKTSRK
jgi:hypothetical protein